MISFLMIADDERNAGYSQCVDVLEEVSIRYYTAIRYKLVRCNNFYTEIDGQFGRSILERVRLETNLLIFH